jgi:hypothetical protein
VLLIGCLGSGAETVADSVESTSIQTYKAPSKGLSDTACWTGSIAAPHRGDAWRCAAGVHVYDPCFEIGDDRVLCEPNPVTGEPGLPMTVTFGDRGQLLTPPDEAFWLLELTDGSYCRPLTGTRFAAPQIGLGQTFACSDGRSVLGEVTTGVVPIAAQVVDGSIPPAEITRDDLEEVSITRAWR